jgi:hypothetical protein
MHVISESPGIDVSADRETLTRDGIVGLKGAFSRDWAECMREDMLTGFWEAIQRPGGAVGRGPRRWYVEIHPQAFGGFADLCAHGDRQSGSRRTPAARLWSQASRRPAGRLAGSVAHARTSGAGAGVRNDPLLTRLSSGDELIHPIRTGSSVEVRTHTYTV